jgi:hypothetical protein
MPAKREEVEASGLLSPEQLEAAEASAARATQLRQEEQEPDTNYPGGKRLHKRGTGPSQPGSLVESDIPYPTDVHGKDFELYGPAGFAANIPKDVEIVAYSGDQEFEIVPERVRHLMFGRPGRNLPKKRLYTIKAIMPDGRLVQLPFEQQIQNNAGGDPEDAIGLRRYQRKGIKVLINFSSLVPVYCAAWGCWAQAAEGGPFIGFCSIRHAQHTLPNQYKDAGSIVRSIFGEGATTSRTWEV